jgi:hypothetical protein
VKWSAHGLFAFHAMGSVVFRFTHQLSSPPHTFSELFQTFVIELEFLITFCIPFFAFLINFSFTLAPLKGHALIFKVLWVLINSSAHAPSFSIV